MRIISSYYLQFAYFIAVFLAVLSGTVGIWAGLGLMFLPEALYFIARVRAQMIIAKQCRANWKAMYDELDKWEGV